MSFNQKSDVKQHLSTRRHKTLLPFRPESQSDITDVSANEPRNENNDTSHEIPAQSGNSVDETPDKKS